jgi:hypothetical protein
MTMVIRRARRWSLAALVAASLGFGASQAMAAPAAAESRAQVCDPVICDRVCEAVGGIGGFCDRGGCLCRSIP